MKLGKKRDVVYNSIEAYACNCNCKTSCSCGCLFGWTKSGNRTGTASSEQSSLATGMSWSPKK
ncbi:CLI_3235 family bacteriocin precursor [Vagococcus fluvialis]|uniref:CLI_3235 family bacteriocin precursor n=1 Tax=Vagococcus fluvialis TaxID=2738 RepID=UPI000B35F9D1|nr:CLI_3235 family bacteriocin precursor [Vagococcus fluvialis]